jgi:hypothetical protein
MLIVLAASVVAAALAAGATIVLTDTDEVAITTPSPLGSPTPESTAEVSPSPSATESPASSPSESGRTSDDEDPSTAHPTRTASSVNCDKEPNFCSTTHGTTVQDDRYGGLDPEPQPGYKDVPKITMRSKVLTTDKTQAQPGDPVESIHVEVVVENDTDETFVFAKREIVLEIRRNGRVIDRLITTGEGFDLTPQGRMTGTFDRPITTDGTYTWQAKTWYYAK